MVIDFIVLGSACAHLSAEDQKRIRLAYDRAVTAHAEQKREDGTPYVNHVIEVALILSGWKADADSICAALLHDVLEDTPLSKADIRSEFGREVATLVEGVTKFSEADLGQDISLDSKIETLRRLFEVMRRDIRVVLIKLADRLHNIRTIHALPTRERRLRFAKETLEVYYKLAQHLGMRSVRREYAEYCVPVMYGSVGDQRKQERDQMCETHTGVTDTVRMSLEKRWQASQFSIQPCDLLVFHRKRDERGGSPLPSDAFSLIAIVKTKDDCYKLLKSLHTLYRPVSGQFKDYIAAPSDAGYQSLHTSVILPDGTAIEMRIRTQGMHLQAEFGIVIDLFSEKGIDSLERFAWLKRSEDLDLHTRESSAAFWEGLESDILKEAISVTIDKKRVSLPKGATALDGAYAVHGTEAARTLSVSVSGQPMSLGYVLQNDDDVSVTLDSSDHVTFEWLNSIVTNVARTLIVNVLKRRSQAEKTALGAQLLQKEMDHYKRGLVSDLRKAQIADVSAHFKREQFDDVLSMIGEGTIRASDVVFRLFPEHQPHKGDTKLRTYAFRLHVTGARERQHDILAQLTDVSRTHEVSVTNTNVRFDAKTGVFTVTLSGESSDRLHYADFVHALERQEGISSVQTLIPYRKKLVLIGSFAVAFILILVDILLFPQYQHLINIGGPFSKFGLPVFTLVPIFIANTYLVLLLRHYVVRMRTDRWFLGVGLMMNIIGLLLTVVRLVLFSNLQASLLPLMAIFVLSLLYLGYKFFQTDSLFAAVEDVPKRKLSEREWARLKRQKIIGYCIRCLAILVWGTVPIYIKYTDANNLSPFLRTFLMGLGVFIPTSIILLIRSALYRKSLRSLSLTYDRYFLMLVIGQIAYAYFQNASLIYTSGTNLLLFNNFAPLIGLIIAAIFWRKDIPYLKQPKTMLWIFLLAVVAGISSSALIYSNAITGSPTVIGDVLAMISTFFEVLLTIGQIEYIKRFKATDGLILNMHIFFFMIVFTAPAIVGLWLLNTSVLRAVSLHSVLLGMGIGLFVGFGQLLNYEAFKRIDGYIAYMMFNLAILITFVVEVFFIHSVRPSLLLLISGALIIGSSVVAEIINSLCQRKGL